MDAHDNPIFSCSSCQSPFDWAPLFFRGETYCCAGCAVGGPCCCSYDGRRPDAVRDVELPMVSVEWERLAREAARLRVQLADAIERRRAEFGTLRDEGAKRLPVWEIEAQQRRLATLESVLGRATVASPGRRPIVGAFVTVQAETGEVERYRLVPPGEDEPTLNHVAFDSAFGGLLARSEVGSSFAVRVPSGARRMTVTEIAYPAEAATAGATNRTVTDAHAVATTRS